MRLVTYKEFLTLPVGTVYSHYKPCIINGLYRKGETLVSPSDTWQPIDFMYVDMLGDVDPDDKCRPPGEWGRDGLYDHVNNRFLLVYEPADIEKLVGLLKGDPHPADGKQ